MLMKCRNRFEFVKSNFSRDKNDLFYLLLF